jgi:tRNA (cmo5U34)-methyltransferase
MSGSPMRHDDLFKFDGATADFEFNGKVAEIFDDMLDRSIPCYKEVIDMIARLLARFLQDGDTVYDLGCSTGTTLFKLAGCLSAMDLRFIGIDSSEPMLRKAALKAEMYKQREAVHFVLQDILTLTIENAGAIICNYTLQFIRPLRRQEFLSRIYESLRPGGVLVISEKTVCEDACLNHAFVECYHQYKKERGYSDLEIARKREALEKVLIPFSSQGNEKLLRQAGFKAIEKIFQWFNFTSFAALK